MRTRIHCFSAAIRCYGIRSDRRVAIGVIIAALAVSVLALPSGLLAQNVAMESSAAPGTDPGAPPVAESGNVNFFSQDLGTLLRLRYNTESYGQDGQGNFDIGSMQVITMEDSAAILDGQVTMNDADGVGFNVGVGYRWMNFPFYSASTGRVDGVAVWADGQHTAAGNFFPQIGASYESLGESWDLRGNMYIPVGPQDKVGDFKPTGITGFQGNSISELTRAIKDSSFTVGELEVARRLGPGRDAWAFAGPYFLTNDTENSGGYRVGVRGYAFPDLLVQLAVSDDDIFKTYATFQVQWFVGRTRSNFQSTCGVPDRMREPFMRNDYVALRKSTVTGGKALTDANGDPLRIVHFDSGAAAGGNGTFEHPYNELNEGNGAGSQEGDILFAHSTSTFDTGITLKNNQRLLGEGNDFEQKVVTKEEGSITIPESSPGARALARPTINIATNSDAIALADSNEVSNFDMDGQSLAGTRAIFGDGASGAGNANLNHLAISNVTNGGIFISQAIITDTNDLDNDNNTTEQLVRGNLTLDTVTFTDVAGNGLDYIGTTSDVTLPNITLSETLAISNVTSTGGTGIGLNIENTHTGPTNTTTLSNYMYDGSTTSAGAIRLANFDGTFTASNSVLTNGSTSGNGVDLEGDSDGTITFQSTVAFNNLDGIAFKINGQDVTDKFGGTVNVQSAITNDTGRSVSIEHLASGASVTFSSTINDTGTGIEVHDNSGGTVRFNGNLNMTIDTLGETAVKLTDNSGATMNFAGNVVIDSTNGADGFVATGGGTLSATSTVNSIRTDTGQDLKITGMTIASTDVKFGDVDRTLVGGAASAIDLENNTGGAIIIGNSTDTVGQAGTIKAGATDQVVINNSSNVTVTGLKIENAAGLAGVHVTKSNSGTQTTNLNDIDVNGGTIGLEVDGGAGAGALTMTVNDVNLNSSTAHGIDINNVDSGSIAFTNVIVDGNNANGTAGGVLIEGSNASITFDTASRIREFGGTDFEVNGGAGTISFAGAIANSTAANAGDTTGRSAHIHGISGGSVTFTAASTIDDDNQGWLVEDNTGGSVNFSGTNTLNTDTLDAITLDNNGGTTIAMTSLNIDTTSGQGLVATNGGNLTVSGFSNTINRTNGAGAGSALRIEGMTIGAVDFESVNASGGAHGIRLVDNTSGTITVGDTGNSAGQGGTITGTADAGVHATNSNFVLNGVTVTNAGDAANEDAVDIFHTNSTNMSATMNRLTVTNATAARDGVTIDGSGGTGTFNANLQNMSVNVTGDGLVAKSGVTLQAGGTNTIQSATGVGLTLTDMAISNSGANFQSVGVSAGATKGIVMTNVTGGQVAITGTGTTANSGGSLTTAGNAIELSNVANVDLLNMQVANAGDRGIVIDHTGGATAAMDVTITNLNLLASTNEGIKVQSLNASNAFDMRITNSTIDERVVMSHTAAGNFGLLLDNNDITTSGTDVAFSLAFGGSALDGDVTVRNGNNFTSGNASAFVLTASSVNTSLELAMDGNTFTNNSADATASIVVNGGATVNSNITTNTFTNAGAGDEFYMESDGSATVVNLNLDNNTTAGIYHLFTQNQGVPGTDFNFNVVDRNNADANNGGTVSFDPVIGDFKSITGPVESPGFP